LEITIVLIVKLAKAEPKSLQRAPSPSDEHGRLCLALCLSTWQERSAGELGHGLVVEDVSGSDDRRGMQPDYVLLGINGQPADSVERMPSMVGGYSKAVALLIERDSKQIFVPVRLS
jgi:serine protease Do